VSSFAGAAKLIAISACGATVLGSMVAGAPRAAADNTLMGTLPQGFSSTNCQQADPKAPAVEKVTCKQSTDPGGPTEGIFARYANTNDLAAAFQTANGQGTVSSSCPGGKASPTTWSYGTYDSSNSAGQVECVTMPENSAAVIWSDNAKLRLSAVIGSDMASLYQWWAKKSG
jgi:hypothetical protein